MELTGEIKHSAYDGKVQFYFREVDPKKKPEDMDYVVNYQCDIPFKIWQKFKDSKIKITVEKIKE